MPEYLLIWARSDGYQTSLLNIPNWQKTKIAESRNYGIAGKNFNKYFENNIEKVGRIVDKSPKDELSQFTDNIHYTSTDNPHITIVFDDGSRIFYYFKDKGIVPSVGTAIIDRIDTIAYKIYGSFGFPQIIEGIFDKIINSHEFQSRASLDVKTLKNSPTYVTHRARGKKQKKSKKKKKKRNKKTRKKPKNKSRMGRFPHKNKY